MSFLLVSISTKIFIDLTYAFFLSNGFDPSPDYKNVFLNSIFNNLSTYGLYFVFYLICNFLAGSMIAYFVMRPFNEIKEYCADHLEDNALLFEPNKMSQRKLIIQATMKLFDFTYNKRKNSTTESIYVPAEWDEITEPQTDKVFYLQYFLFISILSASTSFILYTFINSLHQEIVSTALENLTIKAQSSHYFSAQRSSLVFIYGFCVFVNFIFYSSLSRSIISKINGVSYAVFRDIKEIISGNSSHRISIRETDPGYSTIQTLNNYLDYVLPTAKTQTLNDIKLTPHLVLKEAPPPFVEQNVGNSESFNITTPDGVKFEGLSEIEAMAILKKMQERKKAS